MHNGLMKKIVAMTLALTMALGLMGGAVAEEQPKTVNIGVTDVIGSLNPLLMNATEVLKYANSLVFLAVVTRTWNTCRSLRNPSPPRIT